jgi:hypothetical protein
MRKSGLVAAALVLTVVMAAPALAAWKLAAHGEATAIAGSALRVTPGEDWNRAAHKPNRKSEMWSLDGPSLNELTFVAGLAPGETLDDDADSPLPQMGSDMQPSDIPEFFASSQRLSLGTSTFRITVAEPTEFAGNPGVRFAFAFTAGGSTLARRGIAKATIVDNKLYLISFVAPAAYYFDRDAHKAEVIMDSAHL